MTSPHQHREDHFSTSLPEKLKSAAAEHPDPQRRAALLHGAEKLELGEARLHSVASSGREAIDRFRARVAARRRSRELPGWVVAIVLLVFAAFLVLVGLKHYS